MITNADRRRTGYTLLEVILSIALVGSLSVPFYFAISTAANGPPAAESKQLKFEEATLVITGMEEAIRMSESILQASDGILTVSTRYFVDTDNEEETIRYTVSAGTLYREIAHGGGAYGAPERLVDNVQTFTAQSLKITDQFEREDYDPDSNVIPEGDNPSVDTSVQTEYTVKEMGVVDSDLVDAYDPDAERLMVTGGATPTTIVLSPPVKKKNLKVGTVFTPLDDGATFRALVWGDPSTSEDSVSVEFEPDYSIRFRTRVGGVIIEEDVASFTWEPLQRYEVKMKIKKRKSKAWVSVDGGEYERIGKVNTPEIDDKPVLFQSMTDGARGAWDKVIVSYPLVDLKLALTIDGDPVTVCGAAARRQRGE